MNTIATLLLASLPVFQVQIPAVTKPGAEPRFSDHAKTRKHKGGQWYFARSGHAVYCYGPVMTLINIQGTMEHVATFCRGDQLLVPLKD
jgi:hypothetical protein